MSNNYTYLINEINAYLFTIVNYYHNIYDNIRNLPFIIEPEIVVYGRTCRQRRDILFLSDTVDSYPYSGRSMKAIPLKNYGIINELMEKINNDLGTNFNAVLVNRYNDGTKYISAHSDNESTLNSTSIATICFGPGIRKFRIRRKIKGRGTNPIVLDYEHKSGTLVVMTGINFQNNYTHEIPIQKKIRNIRISLTFRNHNSNY